MTIAVIDDDALDRQICSALIKITSKETQVVEFSNGQAALRHYFENAELPDNLPDVVIVDIKMPLMNGWEYLEAYEIMEPRLVKKPVHYMYDAICGMQVRCAGSNICPVYIRTLIIGR